MLDIEYAMLSYLVEHPRCKVTDLLNHVGPSTPARRLLDDLVARKLVKVRDIVDGDTAETTTSGLYAAQQEKEARQKADDIRDEERRDRRRDRRVTIFASVVSALIGAVVGSFLPGLIALIF